MIPKSSMAATRALDKSGSAANAPTANAPPSGNARRHSALDKESDLITVKNAEDYKNYLRNREGGDTDELSSMNKFDQQLHLIMQDSNSRHSPAVLKGYGQSTSHRVPGAGAGNPSAWTSNAGGSERGQMIENNTNSCITVNDANFPQGANGAYHFNNGSANMDYNTTQYGQGSSQRELTSAAFRGAASYGGDTHSHHKAKQHRSNLDAGRYQDFNSNFKSDIPKASANKYKPTQKPKSREFKVSKPRFLN